MPQWSSFESYARTIDRLDRRMATEAAVDATRRAAEAARPIAYREAARDLGGDPKFSGWRPWLELRVQRERGGTGHRVQPTKTSAGPWTVADQGRNNGFAGPGINRKTGAFLGYRKKADKNGVFQVKRTRQRKRRWNGVTYGWGTSGRAVTKMEDAVLPPMRAAATKAIKRHFDLG